LDFKINTKTQGLTSKKRTHSNGGRSGAYDHGGDIHAKGGRVKAAEDCFSANGQNPEMKAAALAYDSLVPFHPRHELKS
jgi:hypothetical protein